MRKTNLTRQLAWLAALLCLTLLFAACAATGDDPQSSGTVELTPPVSDVPRDEAADKALILALFSGSGSDGGLSAMRRRAAVPVRSHRRGPPSGRTATAGNRANTPAGMRDLPAGTFSCRFLLSLPADAWKPFMFFYQQMLICEIYFRHTLTSPLPEKQDRPCPQLFSNSAGLQNTT